MSIPCFCSDPSQSDPETKDFWLNMAALTEALQRQAEQNPAASYYNVMRRGYQGGKVEGTGWGGAGRGWEGMENRQQKQAGSNESKVSLGRRQGGQCRECLAAGSAEGPIRQIISTML